MRPLVALLLLVAGCSRGSLVGESGSPDAGVSLTAGRLETIQRLAKPDPVWSAVLGARGLRQRDSAFASQGWDDAVGGVPMAFGARVSRFGDGALEIRAGSALVSLRVLEAKGVEGALVEGDAIYPDVHPATDFVVGVAAGRVEAFWSLRDASAPTRFALSLALDGLTAHSDGAGLSLVDDAGQARIRMPQPSAIDARGVRRAASTRLEGSTLIVELDPRGLTYPILLDPALEQVAWTDLGPTLQPYVGVANARPTFPGGLQRASASMRYGNGRVYLFGGGYVVQSGALSHVHVPSSGLFEWSGTAWSASPNGGFADPLVEGDATQITTDRTSDFAWDATRNRLVLFGGVTKVGAQIRLGVYEYDPSASAWTKVCVDDTPCASSAPVIAAIPSAPAAAWAFGKSILVHEAGTYEWDPGAKLLKKFPATPELKRAGASLAFDANRGRLVAYGNGAGASDTWETNGTTWTQVLATGPTAVKNASLAYHPARKRVMLWGSDFDTGGLWSWDGATWSSVTLFGSAPILRPNAAFTYDATTGKLLMFGGGHLGIGSGCYNSFLVPSDQSSDLRACARADTWSSVLFGGACATSAECTGGTTCVDGVCCKQSTCGSCQRCDLAGSVGACAAVVSAEDADSCSGTRSCDATGVCRKKAGQVCALGTDCLSGNCADGICCNSSCPNACESCNQATALGTCTPLPKGAPGKGCAFYTCTGTAGTCAASCTADTDCAPNAFCNASGACVVQQTKGIACTRTRQCATGACVDGVCCDSACSGTCDVCSQALGATANGTCTPLPSSTKAAACAPGHCSGTTAACSNACAVDGDCAAGGFCDGGTCSIVRTKGQSCDRTSQCGTGLTCADGVCCNEACDGTCQACSALDKQSGDKSGECGPAKEGTNPRAKCLKSAVTTCGESGLCGPSGTCAVYPAATPCGPTGSTSCDGDLVKGQTCDGLGACTLDGGGRPCSPSRCVDGACRLSCAVDGDCAADGYCLGGTCKKKAAAGTACAVDAQCSSGFCADGVCCNARCDRSCEACDQAGSAGTCAPVAGAPRLGHPACAIGDPQNPCSASVCDGVERASCAKKAGGEVTCRKGTCEADVEALPAKCDGSGACPASETRPCQPFACGTEACRTTCASDGDCQAGFVCNTATSSCTAADKCAGSVVTKVDGSTVDCAPYTCESSGRCKTACATTADCASPRICNGATCVDLSTPPVEEGGGCALSPRGARTSAAIVLAAVLLAARRRRRACRAA